VSSFVLDGEGGTPLPQVRPGGRGRRAQEVPEGPRGRGPLRRAPVAADHDHRPHSRSSRSKDPRAIASTTPRRSTSASSTKRRRSSPCSETPEHEPDKSTVSAVIRFLGNLRPELRGQLTTIEAKDENSLQGELDTGDDQATVVFGDASERQPQGAHRRAARRRGPHGDRRLRAVGAGDELRQFSRGRRPRLTPAARIADDCRCLAPTHRVGSLAEARHSGENGCSDVAPPNSLRAENTDRMRTQTLRG
jgi:hypothetical protein